MGPRGPHDNHEGLSYQKSEYTISQSSSRSIQNKLKMFLDELSIVLVQLAASFITLIYASFLFNSG